MTNFFIKHYGERPQLKKLTGECWELILAIFSYLIGICAIERVKEEMGDVSSLIGQFEEHWNDGEIYCRKESKQREQMERIKLENKNEEERE